MKPFVPLLVPATLALALLAPPPSEAAQISKPGNLGSASAGHSWSGGSTGHWAGSHGRWSGHHRHWRGGYSPWWGFYAATPFLFGSYVYYSSWDPYWGYWGPRYYGYAYYPRSYPRYDEEDVVRTPREDMGPASDIDPRAPGAPSQGPLYMNYCPSARAYYPKVASCPEGWEFRKPSYRE